VELEAEVGEGFELVCFDDFEEAFRGSDHIEVA